MHNGINDLYLTPENPNNVSQIGALSNNNLYLQSQPKHNVDLRAKLHSLLFGDRYHPPQGRPVIVRHMTNVCPCITGSLGALPSDADKGQKYRDPDPLCSICNGEGYLFTESPYTAWRSTIDNAASILGIYFQRQPGFTADIGFAFFFENTVPVHNLDKIFELALDKDGGNPPVNPAIGPIITDLSVRKWRYRITKVIDYRSDNAEVDFYACICDLEQWT